MKLISIALDFLALIYMVIDIKGICNCKLIILNLNLIMIL
jgi:hypothetical protein